MARYWEWIRLWVDWHTFGLAYPGSPSEQPAIYMDVLRALESEHQAYIARKRG